ncbi:unnamed protein product [Brassica rapa]|uniref:Uncharacterized protein n=1 Tax=Brassica campestris TaxID=3711 RepID=A0A8D9FZ40_BRACM|nr:unnamed protein product [Brassica rapa]
METNLSRTLQSPLKEKERPAEKTKRPSKHWDDHSLTRRNETKPRSSTRYMGEESKGRAPS